MAYSKCQVKHFEWDRAYLCTNMYEFKHYMDIDYFVTNSNPDDFYKYPLHMTSQRTNDNQGKKDNLSLFSWLHVL